MHNSAHKHPKEQSNPIVFLLLTLFGVYLVYLVTTIPFGMGRTKGMVVASYAVPKKDGEAAEEIFNQKELVKPTPELISLGEKIYTNNCASCHGAEGHGDGAAGQRLAVKPRNYHSADGWKVGRSVLDMHHTVEAGLAPAMPGFKASLNQKQIYAVVHYIHATFMKEIGWPEVTPEQIDTLPAPSAAVSINIDPYKELRVPVEYIIRKVAEEEPARGEADGAGEPAIEYLHSDVNVGEKIYVRDCASCHGVHGEGIKPTGLRTLDQLRQLAWGSALTGEDAEWAKDYDKFQRIVVEGEPDGIKPGFATLTEQEMRSLYQYTKSLRSNGE